MAIALKCHQSSLDADNTTATIEKINRPVNHRAAGSLFAFPARAPSRVQKEKGLDMTFLSLFPTPRNVSWRFSPGVLERVRP